MLPHWSYIFLALTHWYLSIISMLTTQDLDLIAYWTSLVTTGSKSNFRISTMSMDGQSWHFSPFIYWSGTGDIISKQSWYQPMRDVDIWNYVSHWWNGSLEWALVNYGISLSLANHTEHTKPNDYITILTHWGRDEIDTIWQTTFLNSFSSMKTYEFWLKFHWSLFVRVQLTIFQHWFR